jgi:Protein of unknown function (DUF2637)
MSRTDRVIAGAAGATVVVLAGVAGALSYSHMAELARLHGEVGWRSHAFPISVDGIEIVASLVLLAHRRSGSRAGWLPWAALATGTAASVAANVAVGASDPVGRLVAGWPAVALLVSIKLLSGLLDAGPRGDRSPASGPDPAVRPAGPGGGGGPRRGVVVNAALEGAGGHGVGPGAPAVPGPLRPRGDHDRIDPAALEVAARAVRDRLAGAGLPVNRRNLAAGLRAAGHRVRNDRLGPLLHDLGADAAAPDDSPQQTVILQSGGGDRG